MPTSLPILALPYTPNVWPVTSRPFTDDPKRVYLLNGRMVSRVRAAGEALFTVPCYLTNVVIGSRYRVEKLDGTLLAEGDAASSTVSLSLPYGGTITVKVKVRKSTSGTKYLPFESQATLGPTGFSAFVSQQQDNIAV